jgi:hypothetical protein
MPICSICKKNHHSTNANHEKSASHKAKLKEQALAAEQTRKAELTASQYARNAEQAFEDVSFGSVASGSVAGGGGGGGSVAGGGGSVASGSNTFLPGGGAGGNPFMGSMEEELPQTELSREELRAKIQELLIEQQLHPLTGKGSTNSKIQHLMELAKRLPFVSPQQQSQQPASDPRGELSLHNYTNNMGGGGGGGGGGGKKRKSVKRKSLRKKSLKRRS